MPKITCSLPPYIPVCIPETEQPAASEAAVNLPGIITDRKTVISHTGIAAEHLAPLQALAAEQQLVISFRPVEAAATGLISAGYPTKNITIKGKSADRGPMAGFIPVDQSYSKICGQKHNIALMNKKVKECLQSGYAVTGDLKISRTRISELVSMGLVISHLPDKNGFITLEGSFPHHHPQIFTAKPASDGLYTIFSTNNNPVQVLCSPALHKPFTADYDLMIVAPRIEDFGSRDIPINPDVSTEAFIQKRPYLLRRNSTTESVHNDLLRREDPRFGNNTPRIAALIPQINAALYRKKGAEVVHHGMDAINPYSDMSTNFPVTFFLPQTCGELPRMLLAQDIKGLQAVIHTLEHHGFMVPNNPLWGNDVSSLRKESFDTTRKWLNTL